VRLNHLLPTDDDKKATASVSQRLPPKVKRYFFV